MNIEEEPIPEIIVIEPEGELSLDSDETHTHKERDIANNDSTMIPSISISPPQVKDILDSAIAEYSHESINSHSRLENFKPLRKKKFGKIVCR